ncbi:TRAP transporter large permease [Marinomonas dokdonensis]|uniref:TRAP transporter large permease n=1 Tax=Marinomonas dokdonensis TaxID=328224 RepID=UPI00405576D6
MSDIGIVITAFVIFTLIGIPIFATVGIATALAIWLIDLPFTLLSQVGYTALEPFPLLTIPLFIFAGRLMEVSGISERMINVAKVMVGSYRGSMGMVSVIGCTLFAALSGSGPATTAAIGSITIPAMKKEGYSPRFAAAVVASAGALGSVIPPSNLLIVYGLVSATSIPMLFMAGLIPGIAIMIFLLLIAYFTARKNNWGETSVKFEWKYFFKVFWEGKWALGTPIIILGGIYGGVFTPTEAAGIAVLYSLIVGRFIYKGLSLKNIFESLKFTALISGLLLLIAPTMGFGQLTAFYDIPDLVRSSITSITDNPFMVMVLIGIFYIIIGTFMESLAQVVLFTGVFLPLVSSLGIDPIMFGIFTVVTCEIGFLTPPLGANLNIAARIAKISIEDVSMGAIPFIFAYILCLLLLIIFPEMATFLPNIFYG